MSKVINEMEKAKVPRAEIIKYLKYIDDPMERRNLEAKLENYQFWDFDMCQTLLYWCAYAYVIIFLLSIYL